MNEVIIRILDSSNNVLGDLDLKDFNDLIGRYVHSVLHSSSFRKFKD